jgi:hypothetical protein
MNHRLKAAQGNGGFKFNLETNTYSHRPGLMFYEFNVFDPMGGSPAKRSIEPVLRDSFSGSMNELALITILVDKEALFSSPVLGKPKIKASVDFVSRYQDSNPGVLQLPNVLPDGYVCL